MAKLRLLPFVAVLFATSLSAQTVQRDSLLGCLAGHWVLRGAMHWIVEGHGYDVTGREVLDVFYIVRAAETGRTTAETSQHRKSLIARDAPDGPVRRVLGHVLTTN
jgi:hypothetical protein